MTDIATRPEQVLVDAEFRRDLDTLAANPPYPLGTIAPGEPTYLIPDNQWLPWANRSAGFAIGAWAVSITSLLLGSPLLLWSVATSITATLLFAFVVAGHELREKHPTRFKQAA